MTDSLRMTDQEAAANASTPNRVTLDSMLSKVEHVEYWHPSHTPHLTICILTMHNGFVVVGTSAPADAANYDENLGQKFAHEDCIRQLWRFEGYLLRESMYLRETTQHDHQDATEMDTGGPEEGPGGAPV